MDTMIYLGCFGFGLAFALLSATLGHLFGSHDVHIDTSAAGHPEAGFHTGDMPGMSPFSPTVIATFITAFGGFGLIFSRLEATQNPWVSAPLAFVGGLVVAVAVFLFFEYVFSKTQGSSESNVAGVIGHEAIIITPIPENGVGEIAYVQRGTRYTAPARTENGNSIESGKAVQVTRVIGSQFYVTNITRK